MVWHRIFEAAVISFCAGCAVAAIVDRICGAAVIFGSVTAFAVAAWLLSRRWPTPLDAAKSIDSQMRWDELLQSAIATSNGSNAEHFGCAVTAVADARCDAADISLLKFGRLTALQKLAAVFVLLASAAVWVSPRGSTSSSFSSAGVLIDDPSPRSDAETGTGSSSPRSVAAAAAVDESSSRRGGVEAVTFKPGGLTTPGNHGELARSSGLGASTVVESVSAVETTAATGAAKAGDVVGGDGVGVMATQGLAGRPAV